jgi:hypothetical protein
MSDDSNNERQSRPRKSFTGDFWVVTHRTGEVRSLFYYETEEDAENKRNCYGYEHIYPYKVSV